MDKKEAVWHVKRMLDGKEYILQTNETPFMQRLARTEAEALRQAIQAMDAMPDEDDRVDANREARLEYIKANITEAAMLAQIAEEAAELSAAAAKMLRILDGTNPTPVTSKDAVLAMREEFADVLNACAVYGITPYSAQDDAAQKMERWAWRIAKEVQGGEE